MPFDIIDLGLIDFIQAASIQKEIVDAVRISLRDSSLIFCQHYPVITFGRQAKIANLTASFRQLQNQGIQVSVIDRGGDITYHGPGQLIVYPILDLERFKKDIHWFLRKLELCAIDLLEDFKITACQRPGLTGVWVKDKKICSIGISVKDWVTSHGLSLNISEDDLVNYKLIRPCGMDIEMTSVESECGNPVDINLMKSKLGAILNKAFLGEYQQALA